jgi:hypothetical protein
VISALRALYAYAIERRYVEFNPADGLTMPSGEDEDEDEPPGPPQEDGDYEPIAVLPERLLSLALRAALIVFAVVAIISLVQPA